MIEQRTDNMRRSCARHNPVNAHPHNQKDDIMAARTRKTVPTVDPILDTEIVLDTPEDAPVETKNRKYFSHANCTHARKGEAGKAARATCRRDIRAWLKAEEEFNNTDELLAV